MIATAAQAMATFEHADAAFAADAPPLPATEPALTFIRAPWRGLRPASGQDHTAHATFSRCVFVGRRTAAAIARGQIRRAAEDRLMPIQCCRPQGDVGRSLGVDVVAGDDLMFRFLNGHELAELVRL